MDARHEAGHDEPHHETRVGLGGPACETGCVPGVFPLRSASQFSNRCTTMKNVGTNSTARQVEAIMPENTVIPIDLYQPSEGLTLF